MIKEEQKWLKEFIILIITSAILSGIAYFLQSNYFPYLNWDRWYILSGFVRMIRMILVYVIPVLWFLKRYGGNWRDLGVLPAKKGTWFSFLGGTGVYLIAAYFFVKYESKS